MNFKRHASPNRRGVEGLKVALLALAALALPACEEDINDDSAVPAVTRRVSVSVTGEEANRDSDFPDISADGRYVVFQSQAGNLVPGDSNGKFDIFRKDLVTGAVVMVSTTEAGAPGDGDSTNASISADGRFVAFQTLAANLDPGDTDPDDGLDVYVKDLDSGAVTHVSQSAFGGPPAGTSVESRNPRLSPGGRFLVFVSTGEDLDIDVPNLFGDPEVFLRDLETGETFLVSRDAFGDAVGGACENPSVSDDGRFVVYQTGVAILPGDAQSDVDIYLRDRQLGINERVSTGFAADPDGNSLEPRITPDGRFVIFSSEAPDLIDGDLNGQEDVFIRDRQAPASTRCVSLGLAAAPGAGQSRTGVLTPDGRFAAFRSAAPNLVAGDTNGTEDYFWRDLERGSTRRVTVRTGGAQTVGNGGGPPGITSDGRYVVFVSDASDLTIGDSNAETDVYVRGPLH
ncbi:MAG TPA: hypothetical protein VF950_03765 [Planctomycetota bacterium]